MNNELKSKARRNFLRYSAAGAGVAALGAIGEQAQLTRSIKATALPNHKRLIVINMLGGNDGLNTVFPVSAAEHAAYMNVRPTLGFAQGAGLALTGGPGVNEFELHPSLANVQTRWNANQVAIINKVGYPQQNLSHFVSEDIWSYGARGGLQALGGSVAPGWVARYANTYAPTNMGVASIGVGRRLDFEGATASPFLVSSVASFNYRVDFNYSNNHALRIETIQNILAQQPAGDTVGDIAVAGASAFTAAAQVQAAVADYNNYATLNGIQYPIRAGTTSTLTTMGSRLRDIALLIHGGFETRVFYTGYGGFDTHSNQLAGHAALLTDLDDALGVFFTDMTTQGVWNDIAIVVISEFGRRNYENGSNGTDHGHGSCVMVLGGPVNGGMYGDDPTVADLNLGHLGYTTDFRDIYRALLLQHLGHDPALLFPETQPTSNIYTLV
ncbi:MAG: DUF1501 domain-containing protein [Planctomycetes bacterium]|nr:DUF1501 domain-containing protein [Planctomycetota bacterium]